VVPVETVVKILFGLVGYQVLVFLSVRLALVLVVVAEELPQALLMVALEEPAVALVVVAQAVVLHRVQELLEQVVLVLMAS